MSSESSVLATRFKVGLFTLLGLGLIGFLTVFVNDRPYWWRPCQSVKITIDDATGLKTKSPVKSLGLEIGYISTVVLVDAGVQVHMCLTAPVELLESTRAYVKAEGFLGDKYLELRPVKHSGVELVAPPVKTDDPKPLGAPLEKEVKRTSHRGNSVALPVRVVIGLFQVGVSTASAQNAPAREVKVGEKNADVEQLMNQMSGLVKEVRSVTTNLRDAINPEEVRSTIRQLNKTLENASKALSPESGLTATAQRSLLKLEDAIEQARDQMSRINQGKGSVGMLLNDPEYAEEIKRALTTVNKILDRTSKMRLMVNLGVHQLNALQSARAFFEIELWTRPDRYYEIGLATDPRGNISQTSTVTQVGGVSTTVNSTRIERGGFSITAMIGKVFYERFDLALGLRFGDGVTRLRLNLGPDGRRDELQWVNELYFRPTTDAGSWTVIGDWRSGIFYQPIPMIYFNGGIEGLRKLNGSRSFFYGAGLRFDDDDIKLLLSFL